MIRWQLQLHYIANSFVPILVASVKSFLWPGTESDSSRRSSRRTTRASVESGLSDRADFAEWSKQFSLTAAEPLQDRCRYPVSGTISLGSISIATSSPGSNTGSPGR